jgi:hypothetical protein
MIIIVRGEGEAAVGSLFLPVFVLNSMMIRF